MTDLTDLTAADIRALRLLINCKALMRPGFFGELLWPDSARKSGNCSAPYARQAGKVLGRLRKAGCAEYIVESKDWGWQATRTGRALIVQGVR